MSFLDSWRQKLGIVNINEGVKKQRSTPGSILLDVRSESEYRRGHIKGSVHLPMERIAEILTIAPDKDTPLFLYCLSGARSDRMARELREAGYTQVESIGAITDWNGKKVR